MQSLYHEHMYTSLHAPIGDPGKEVMSLTASSFRARVGRAGGRGDAAMTNNGSSTCTRECCNTGCETRKYTQSGSDTFANA